MGRKMPRELSKKNLIRDNAEMIGTIKWMRKVMDEQLASNIELHLEIEKLKKKLEEK